LGFAVPLELPGLLELDLTRRGDQPWLRPVRAAVAHAEGLGMPERVIAYVAPRLTSPRQREGDRAPLEDLRQALDQAFFYLRRDIDTNATTLYRLFHEGLAERLRVDPYGPPKEKRGMSTSGGSPYALAVFEGLLDSMPTAAGGRYAWHVGAPYLLRHAAQHARDAGRVDQLLEDPEFPTTHGGDPEELEDPLVRQLMAEWLDALAAPAPIIQGALSLPLRYAAMWVAEKFSLNGRLTHLFIQLFFREVAAYHTGRQSRQGGCG
jgi:hypothetical protein